MEEVQKDSTAVGMTPCIICLVTGLKFAIKSFKNVSNLAKLSKSISDAIAETAIVLKNTINIIAE
jgi:hypothetical protein